MSGKRKTSFVLKSIPHFQLSVYDTPKNTHPVNMKPISIDHLSIFLDLHLLSCNLSLKNNEQNLSKKPLFQKKSPVSTELSTMTHMSQEEIHISFSSQCDVIFKKYLHPDFVLHALSQKQESSKPFIPKTFHTLFYLFQ